MTKTTQTKRNTTTKAKAPAAVASAPEAAAADAVAPPAEGAEPSPAPKADGDAQAPSPRQPSGKLGALIALLKRPDGADIGDMMQATGWQAHSVRGAMSGALKKKLGLTITSEKSEAGRIYRIVEEGAR